MSKRCSPSCGTVGQQQASGMLSQQVRGVLYPDAVTAGRYDSHLHRQPGAEVARHGTKVACGPLVIGGVERHHSGHTSGWVGYAV